MKIPPFSHLAIGVCQVCAWIAFPLAGLFNGGGHEARTIAFAFAGLLIAGFLHVLGTALLAVIDAANRFLALNPAPAAPEPPRDARSYAERYADETASLGELAMRARAKKHEENQAFLSPAEVAELVKREAGGG